MYKTFFLGGFYSASLSQTNLWVFLRGAASGTPKYPHKTTLICKVVLSVEVQHLVPAQLTQINAEDRILDVRKVLPSNHLQLYSHPTLLFSCWECSWRESLKPQGKRQISQQRPAVNVKCCPVSRQRHYWRKKTGQRDLRGTDRCLNKVPLMSYFRNLSLYWLFCCPEFSMSLVSQSCNDSETPKLCFT